MALKNGNREGFGQTLILDHEISKEQGWIRDLTFRGFNVARTEGAVGVIIAVLGHRRCEQALGCKSSLMEVLAQNALVDH